MDNCLLHLNYLWLRNMVLYEIMFVICFKHDFSQKLTASLCTMFRYAYMHSDIKPILKNIFNIITIFIEVKELLETQWLFKYLRFMNLERSQTFILKRN